MQLPRFDVIARTLAHVLDAPARAVIRWSDDADEVWAPFLDDAPPIAAPPLAA